MISTTTYVRLALLILAASFGVAQAQSAPPDDSADSPPADTSAAADVPDANDLGLDWTQLDLTASPLTASPNSKARLAPRTGPSTEMSWSSSDKANGSKGVAVKQPVSPFWDTRIGADMTVARQPATLSELLSDKVANGGSDPQSSGSAWAAATAPGVGSIWDKTALEARVDPAQDRTKLGTSLSKSVPLSEQYSLTLQNGYNVIQQGSAPVPGLAGRPLRNYETEQSAKLSITDTGTSLIAGQSMSTTDDKWLRKLGAEQKLFGGVSISGTIGETAQGTANKSLSAGFKKSW
jgi:hypothetical protein